MVQEEHREKIRFLSSSPISKVEQMQIVSWGGVHEIWWPDRGEAVVAPYPTATRGFPIVTHAETHIYHTYVDNWTYRSAQTDKLSMTET